MNKLGETVKVVLIGTHIHIYIKDHVTRITVGIGWGYIDLDAFSELCFIFEPWLLS